MRCMWLFVFEIIVQTKTRRKPELLFKCHIVLIGDEI